MDSLHICTPQADGAAEVVSAVPAPAPAPAPGLAPGARVRIFGLQSAEGLKLNGIEGKLQSLSPETGRWNVILDSGEVKAIKSTNLEVRPGTAS